MNGDAVKFGYVAVCFIVALASYGRGGKKDWACLAAGMACTAAADFFLLVAYRETVGVAVFIFAHVFYIGRAGGRPRVLAAAVGGGLLLAGLSPLPLLPGLAALYAGLFGWDLVINLRQYKARPLIGAGLVLFALCDICVGVYNLPRFAPGMENAARAAHMLIWWFYAPAQGLLAASGWTGGAAR